MKAHVRHTLLLLSFLTVLLLALPLAAQTGGPPLADVENGGTKLIFYPNTEFNELVLTVNGPCDFQYREVVTGGAFAFYLDQTTIDGAYTYELVRYVEIDPDIIKALQQARVSNDPEVPKALCRDGKLPPAPTSQSEGFVVYAGKIVYEYGSSEESFGESQAAIKSDRGPVVNKDFVILDDLIVDGSACIGFDCVNGESFGFDTVRLKENNLRIKFDDTSVAASFPRNDWQLTANDSANGGTSKFSIDDISGGHTPFTVEANARSHSLYVDDGGRIGNRTSTPSVEIHTVDGDTPTLRLQQDGSSGFAPQTWDVAGNETNFFVRDVTNGSTLPFRIRPGAPTSSIFIDVDGNVGMGTASPEVDLHVEDTSGNAELQLETSGQSWKWRANSANGQMNIIDNTNSKAPFRIAADTDSNLVSLGIDTAGSDAASTVSFGQDGGGNVTVDIQGSVVVDGAVEHADYVFEPDFELETIADHATFMWENKHLPALPKAPASGKGRVDLVSHQMGVLEELEKAHIYIDQLHGRIGDFEGQLQELRGLVQGLLQERADNE
jgi:hypothetical protein